MQLACLAGLDHQPDLGAQTFADQMMVHRGRRQQRGHGDMVGIHLPVRQDDDVVAGPDRFLGALADPVDRARHAGGPLFDRKQIDS